MEYYKAIKKKDVNIEKKWAWGGAGIILSLDLDAVGVGVFILLELIKLYTCLYVPLCHTYHIVLQELKNSVLKDQLVIIKVCRPCDLCHNYPNLRGSGKAAMDM